MGLVSIHKLIQNALQPLRYHYGTLRHHFSGYFRENVYIFYMLGRGTLNVILGDLATPPRILYFGTLCVKNLV